MHKEGLTGSLNLNLPVFWVHQYAGLNHTAMQDYIFPYYQFMSHINTWFPQIFIIKSFLLFFVLFFSFKRPADKLGF